MQFDVEYTDTFSGEANYSWVRRASLTGVPGKTIAIGDTLAFYPRGLCAVMFVSFI